MNTQGRRRRRDMIHGSREPRADESWATAILSLAAGALLTVTTGLWIMLELERFGPIVGSIIVFKPDASAAEGWSVNARIAAKGQPAVTAADGNRSCVLSPSVMAKRGGSLIIEARRLSRPPVYRVHWAGSRTDLGAGDCGPAADLVLERTALMRLANVTGGFRMIGP